MLVELDRKDIVLLLKGIKCPAYEFIEKLTRMGLGRFYGGMGEHWEWNLYIYNSEYSDEELYELYLELKEHKNWWY